VSIGQHVPMFRRIAVPSCSGSSSLTIVCMRIRGHCSYSKYRQLHAKHSLSRRLGPSAIHLAPFGVATHLAPCCMTTHLVTPCVVTHLTPLCVTTHLAPRSVATHLACRCVATHLACRCVATHLATRCVATQPLTAALAKAQRRQCLLCLPILLYLPGRPKLLGGRVR